MIQRIHWGVEIVRICYLIHVFPPESWGGSENYVFRLAQQLRLQHEIRVLTRTHRSDEPEYKIFRENVDGLEVFRLNNNFRDVDRFERIYWNPKVDEIMETFLGEWRPDIIHAHHLTCLSTNLVNIAHRHSIPFVLTLHDFWMMCLRGQRLHPTLRLCEEVLPSVCGQCVKPWMDGAYAKAITDRFGSDKDQRNLLNRARRKLFKFLTRPNPSREIEAFHQHSRRILKEADLLISPSVFLRDEFVRFGCDPEKILLSDNGIDPGLVGREDCQPSSKVRFGFVGTLIPSKGVHVLVAAFRQMPPGRAELKIFGGAAEFEGFPDYFENLQRQAQGLPIEFRGKFANKEIGRVLSEIDVLIVPSIWFENAPLTIREALLAQIPVITADRGGMAESVQDGVNGLLFEMGNPKSLANAMLRLVEEPALLEELGSAETPVKTIADNARELEEIYARLCKMQ